MTRRISFWATKRIRKPTVVKYSTKRREEMKTKEHKLDWYQRGRIITIFEEYFKSFLEKERAIAGNKIYTFSSRAKGVFLKDLLGEKLSKRNLRLKEEYNIKDYKNF